MQKQHCPKHNQTEAVDFCLVDGVWFCRECDHKDHSTLSHLTAKKAEAKSSEDRTVSLHFKGNRKVNKPTKPFKSVRLIVSKNAKVSSLKLEGKQDGKLDGILFELANKETWKVGKKLSIKTPVVRQTNSQPVEIVAQLDSKQDIEFEHLSIVDIPRDGNCTFHALSAQLREHDIVMPHQELRTLFVTEANARFDEFKQAGIVTEDDRQALQTMAEDGKWDARGNIPDMVIQVLQTRLGFNAQIWNVDPDTNAIQSTTQLHIHDNLPVIQLARQGCHYNIVAAKESIRFVDGYSRDEWLQLRFRYSAANHLLQDLVVRSQLGNTPNSSGTWRLLFHAVVSLLYSPLEKANYFLEFCSDVLDFSFLDGEIGKQNATKFQEFLMKALEETRHRFSAHSEAKGDPPLCALDIHYILRGFHQKYLTVKDDLKITQGGPERNFEVGSVLLEKEEYKTRLSKRACELPPEAKNEAPQFQAIQLFDQDTEVRSSPTLVDAKGAIASLEDGKTPESKFRTMMVQFALAQWVQTQIDKGDSSKPLSSKMIALLDRVKKLRDTLCHNGDMLVFCYNGFVFESPFADELFSSLFLSADEWNEVLDHFVC